MNTKIQGTYVPFTCTNLTQTLSRRESNLTLDLADMVLTTSANYSRVYTLTMTISAVFQSAAISIECSQLNGLLLTRVGNVYTISSEYVNAQGVKMNNWAYFKLAIQSLRVIFTNTDVGETFTIANSLTDGATTLTGITTVNTIAVPDVTGHNQTVTVPMAMNGNSLVSAGGTNLLINDANQASKTYRVTLTANNLTNASGTADMRMNIDSGVWSNPLVLTGTQAAINTQLTSAGMSDGLNFHNYNMNFYGTTQVSYLQEVLTNTEIGAAAPYVQEVGTLNFNTTYTAPFALGTAPTYAEDSSVTFSLGSITDLAGTSYAHETCGVYQGYNCYTLTATLTPVNGSSGTNLNKLTYTGDLAIDNVVTFTGSKVYINSMISSLQLIPASDYTAPLSIAITLTRGNTPATIYTGTQTVICTSTHADVTLFGSQSFILGSNTWNIGAITDLAVGKSYRSRLSFLYAIDATLSSSGVGGTSTWFPTAGIGYGQLEINGTKDQVNSHLASINFTTSGSTTADSTDIIIYDQDQLTDNSNHGQYSISVGNTLTWKDGNGIYISVPAFVYDQDIAMTWDLASLGGQINDTTSYTVKIVFSTPLSTSNLGSVTGWTKETDYIWSKTGLKAALNSALSAVVFCPPAQLVSDFTINARLYDGATLIIDTATTNSFRTVYIRNLASTEWTSSALTYNQDSSATWTNVATLNSNFWATTYTLRLLTSVETGGTLTGWTTINSTTFEKTDTKANLQNALNNLTFTPSLTFVSDFTFYLEAYRSSLLLYTSTTKSISINLLYEFTPTSTSLYFNQDETTTWDFGSFNAAFDSAKTYTVRLTTNVATSGVFTGWTVINSTTVEKTGTGAALISALDALTYVSTNTFASSFSIILSFYRSGTLLYTAPSKSMLFGGIINFIPTSNNLVFSQDQTKTFAPFGTFSPNINLSDTYTVYLYVAGVDLGTFTGWTFVTDDGTPYYEKTGTGAQLVTAVSSLEFLPRPDLTGNQTIQVQLFKNDYMISYSSTIYLYCNVQYSITAGSNTTPTFNQNSTNNWNNLFSFSSLWTNSNTYTFVIETKNSDGILSDLGTLTGWTNTSTGVYTKTDTSSNLISAANALVFVSNYSNANAFRIQLKVFDGIIGIIQYPTTYITINPLSTYNITLNAYNYALYESARSNTNLAVLSDLYSDAGTYTLTLSVSSYATLTPTGGWTSVNPQTISVTGNKTAIQNALNAGTSITTSQYVNFDISAQINVTTGGNSINTKNFYFTMLGTPTISIGRTDTQSYYFIGGNTDITGNATSSIVNTDTYAIKVSTNAGSVINDLTAPGLTFTVSNDYTYGISNYVTMPQLITGINSLVLNTRAIGGSLSDNTTTIQVTPQLLAPSPFIAKTGATKTLGNGAAVGILNTSLTRYGTTRQIGVLTQNATTVVSLGNTDIVRSIGNTSYYSNDTTYTAEIVGLSNPTGFIINNWENPQPGTYRISGNKAFIDSQLTALSVTITVSGNVTKYVDLKIYTAGIMILKQQIAFGITL